jgi:hypothetical protein
MSSFLAGLLAVYVAIALGVAIWSLTTRGEQAARRASAQAGLPLPEEPLRSIVIDRLLTTLRWTCCSAAVGALLGVGACIAVALAANRDPEPSDTGFIWLAFAGFVLGGSVGAVLAVTTAKAPQVTGRPRIARSARRELGDYLDAVELNIARVVAALGTACAIATLILPPTTIFASPTPTLAVVLAATGLVAWTILELGGRYIVLARPRIAESEAELAWDDAFRAADLRRLTSAVLMSSGYATAFAGLPLLAEAARSLLAGTAMSVAADVSFYVFLAILIAAMIIVLRRDPAHHYLRRLWPEIAPQNTAAAADARVAAAQAAANARAAAAHTDEATR